MTTVLLPRQRDLREALALTYVTLAWMTIEGAVSLWLGAHTGSLLLDGFGFDSILELVSAAVLLWRLTIETRPGADEERIETAERRAAQIVGYTLYILAASIVISSVWKIFGQHAGTDTHESAWGIVIGIVAKVGMPALAARKIVVAKRLGSAALRADAMEAITCGYLSVVLVAGLAATRVLGWWWLDSAAALILVPFLCKEAREAITGYCSCSGGCSND